MGKPIYFVGAGPGDPDLITLKAYKILKQADLIVYAGSLVPKKLFKDTKARLIDSSFLTLDQVINHLAKGYFNDLLVARVHTGEPSLYGTLYEQFVELDKLNIPYEVIPGISSAFALAAKSKLSFTLPEINQTLIFTRVSGKTPVPKEQDLENLGKTKSALAIFLSALQVKDIQKKLLQAGYCKDSPVIMGYRVGWPEEKIVVTKLDKMSKDFELINANRQVLFIILPAKSGKRSKLYSPLFSHLFRQKEED